MGLQPSVIPYTPTPTPPPPPPPPPPPTPPRSLFEVAIDKFITVVEAWNHLDGKDDWNLNCVRAFNDWEIHLVAKLLHVLQKERVSTKPDRVIWKGAADATFTMRNAYNLLVPRSISRFPVKNIWMASVPSKVSLFAWEAA